ncbi:anti-sigma factor family protein [Peterkaempfera bronchialis]|uniref:Putative zinc-finger domain-containing protein n=1 Tax=Peterkaempfera bronchialis TaxID=2126346 RepID=A0A345SY09_9ACTN|nr:zf-HC2 domain-containing protein [Peterkaempfera bronchialis]AXI78614.1 hypothetical protein C7M71_015440 [Peterkaempfera bronchialis]
MTPTTPGTGPTEPPLRSSADNTSGPADHPAVEEISDFTEDLLAPEAAAAVRTHLADCPECADTRDALLEIRSLLGRPESLRMPADIAERIDAALAAEALLSSATPQGEPRPAAPPTAADRASDAADPARPAPSTSAEHTGDSAPPHPAKDRARPGGSPGPAGGPGRRRGPRRRRTARALLTAAALVAAVGLGSVLLQQLPVGTTEAGSSHRADRAAGQAAPSAAEGSGSLAHGYRATIAPGLRGSGTEYTEQDLGPQIMQLVSDRIEQPGPLATARPGATAKPPGEPHLATKGSGSSAYTPGVATPPLPGCVLKATGRGGDEPVATDLGTFQGTPVGVVVYPIGQTGDILEVFLIDSTCERTAPSAPGAVKLHRTVPKP